MPGPKILGAMKHAHTGPDGRGVIKRYGLTLFCVAAAIAIRWSLNPLIGNRFPWIFFLPAVVAAAWYGGLGPGLLTSGLSVLAGVFLWVEPGFGRGSMWVSIAAFLISALFINVLAELSNRARRDLELERTFFSSVLSSVTDGFVVLGPDWRYSYVNEAAARITRRPAVELLERVVWELFPQVKGTTLELELLRSRRENVPVQFEMSYPENDLWLEFRAHPMGNSTAIYVADISARKQAELELARAKEQLAGHASQLQKLVHERTATLEDTVTKLEDTVVELERFSYTISHDLRAPLRAIQSFAQFVEEDYAPKLDDTARDYLGRIRGAAQRMDRLIHDVLAYARTSRGELKLEPVEMDPLLEEVVRQYTPEAAGNIQIRHPLGQVQGSRTLLTQVVSNLLGNAVKFVPAGAPPNVEVWSERADGRVRIFFKDAGVGIPAEARQKVFGIFEKGHGNAYPGTGIGLAIVKRALERMDGRVSFDSAVNQGSTFWIELPGG